MLDFLEEIEKKGVKREYFFRVCVVALFLCFVLCVFAVGLLIPSYFLSDTKERLAEMSLPKGETASTTLAATASQQVFADLGQNLALLAPLPAGTLPSDVIATLLRQKPTGVKIISISYQRGIAPAVGTLSIVGIAGERTVLVDYVKSLQAEKIFSSVDFPISNLAKEKDIDFTIQASGTF